MRIVVVLPAPFGPMNPNRSPRLKFKLIDLMAYNSPYFFVKSRVSIIVKLSKYLSFGSNTESLPNHKTTNPHSVASPARRTDILSQRRPVCPRPHSPSRHPPA